VVRLYFFCTTPLCPTAFSGSRQKPRLMLEKNAQIYLYAKLVGTPNLFRAEDIAAMQDFAKNHYGKKNQGLM